MSKIHADVSKTYCGNYIWNAILNIPFNHAAVDYKTDAKNRNYPIQNDYGFRVRILQFLICKDKIYVALLHF